MLRAFFLLAQPPLLARRGDGWSAKYVIAGFGHLGDAGLLPEPHQGKGTTLSVDTNRKRV